MSRQTRAIDLTGQQFGYLFVLHRVSGQRLQGRIKAVWLCRCDCGVECEVLGIRLRAGRRKACGQNGHRFQITNSPRSRSFNEKITYGSWGNMRRRCNDPKHKKYYLYGAKGIKVCERWDSFTNFLEDMGYRPSQFHSIDRIDGTKDYTPDNCRWATTAEQSRNRCNNIYVEYEGQRVLLCDLVKQLGKNYAVVKGRLNMGWSLDGALFKPVRFHNL